jgi:hypothetical protein
MMPAILCLVPLALTLPPRATQPGDSGAQPASVFPGGIIDRQAGVVYVQDVSGAIEAVDLATGKVQWRTDSFAQPLALLPDRLLVQAPVKGKGNVVYLVQLDIADKGKQLRISDPITFPDWVNTGTAHGRSFQSLLSGTKGGAVLLSWEARAWYAGGARPTPEIEKAARKEAHGIAEVDLKTGKVTMRDGEKVPMPDEVLPKNVEKLESAQYWTGSSWQKKPFLSGPKVVSFSRTKQGPDDVLMLETWDRLSGKPDLPVELMRGKELWLHLGADKRHLFVHQALVPEKLPKGDYAWWVFDVTNGQPTAKIPFEPGVQSIAVVGKTVYYVTEQTKLGPKGGQRTRLLKAVNAASGQEVWQLAIYAPPVLPPLP